MLARLVTLAEQHHWRLALIGDHRQLQAVGRGGLFHELCVSGRSIELTRIHRFAQAWEAAASLHLRHGDPRGLNAYFNHGRVIADTFDNHLTRIADLWLDTNARHGTAAITTSTNEHVDAINAAVQTARINTWSTRPNPCIIDRWTRERLRRRCRGNAAQRPPPANHNR